MLWPWRRKPLAMGPRGEKLALKRLKRQGCKILATNYRCPAGEIDIIALDTSSAPKAQAPSDGDPLGTIVFVEVKTRASDRYTSPASAVDADKQARIRRSARYYLSTTAAARGLPIRFDIISVVLPADGKPDITHMPDAFQ